MDPCGLAGSGAHWGGCMAGEPSPLLPGLPPWRGAGAAGWCALAAAAWQWLLRALLLCSLHVFLTCGTWGIHPSTSTPQVSEGGHLLECPAEAPLSAVSAQRWRWRQVLFRGVYSSGLANPATANVHDCHSGSPSSPLLQQLISVSGSTGQT